ncbi:MAG: signal transduction histidine kinase [Cocleimonas sp.]|jgi:signal transduction histidine kinase
MFQSLYSRLALVLLGVFLTMGILLFWFFQQASMVTQNIASQRLHKEFAVNVVRDLGVTNGDDFDPQRIKEAFHQMMIIGPTLELYIVDGEGKVIAYQAAEDKIKRRVVDLQPIKQFIEGKDEYPILGDDPRSLNKEKIFSAAKIYSKDNQIVNQSSEDEGVFIGYLYAIIGGEKHDSIFSSLRSGNAWKISLIGISSGFLFLLLASLLLFYALTRPLRKLTKEIKAFEDSDFKKVSLNQGLQVEEKGEFSQLKHSFYQMEQRIVTLLERLNKQDELRREFLAYLSHDLRTPLAGMKAYIETVELKEDSMPLAERQDFLKKALINGDRLEGMINELFELTRLDNNQVSVNKDEFPIGDLLSDISNSLESKANSKGLTLRINCENPQAEVLGDIAKIERVIQNLVENAVRYSEKGKEIVLHTSKITQGELLVKVIDSGSGIAADQLPLIFQPYYQASNQQTSIQQDSNSLSADKQTPDQQQTLKHKGAGLGLAICQRLLALQDVELMAESELGKGTVFSFSLKTISS